jgi:hypothetical protein
MEAYMAFLESILGGSAAKPIEAIGGVFDSLFTSDEERMQAQAVLEKLRQHPGELQAAINQVEAQHRTIFVAGWRPFLGWVGGIGLAFTFLINPIIQWISGDPGPSLPTDVIMELVLGLLGLGAMRTVEKVKGRTK